MSNHATNLRRTRADMLGTDDEVHYWECHEAADYIEELESYLDEEREKNEKQVRMTMDLQAEMDSLRERRNAKIERLCLAIEAKDDALAVLRQYAIATQALTSVE